LRFADGTSQKFDNLDQGKTGTFQGTGLNAGKKIRGAWIKSGTNAGWDGPGYGEWIPNDGQRSWAYGYAQMSWEDLLVNSDYDYNDFVGRLRITETRDSQNRLVQIEMVVKAVARAAGYDGDFQFNVNGSFPGQNITSIVDQYYANKYNADGTPKRHGNQRAWRSDEGISLPVFTPLRNALPNPPGTNITNGIPGTQFIEGDYAVVKIVFANPVAAGTYTPMPYKPELRVEAGSGSTYIINLWQKKGDWVDSNGRPLAFIVSDSFTWPLEGKPIWTVYLDYTTWINWVSGSLLNEPIPHFWDRAPVNSLAFSRDQFTD
jgi:LruC domain-containing protein